MWMEGYPYPMAPGAVPVYPMMVPPLPMLVPDVNAPRAGRRKSKRDKRGGGYGSDRSGTGSERDTPRSSRGGSAPGTPKRQGMDRPSGLPPGPLDPLSGVGLAVSGLQPEFLEEAVLELNRGLGDKGYSVRLPLLNERDGETCQSVAMNTLLELSAVSPSADEAGAMLLCQALAVVLSWCTAPFLEDDAVRVFDVLNALVFEESENVKLASLAALHAFFKSTCFPKKKQAVLSRALALLPADGDDATALEASVAGLLLRTEYPVKLRTLAATCSTYLLEQVAPLMQQAAPMSAGRFVTYAEKLGCVLLQVHKAAIGALRQQATPKLGASDDDPPPLVERSPIHTAALLHLLQSTITLTPYHRLAATADLVVDFVPDLFAMLCGQDKGTVIAAMQALVALCGTKRPFAQFSQFLAANGDMLAEINRQAATRTLIVFRHECVRMWASLAHNYPPVVRDRWDALVKLVSEFQEAPDQMSKLTAIAFIAAASEPATATLLQPTDEIPVIDFACFGESHLPPGADPAEVNLAGDLMRRPSGAHGAEGGKVRDGCVLEDNPEALLSVLKSVIVPLTDDPVAAVRGHAVATLTNLSRERVDELSDEDFALFFTTLRKMCRDVNNTVKGAAAKVLGVWVWARRVLPHKADVAAELLAMFDVPQQTLHQKAAWAVSSLCEHIRDVPEEHHSNGALIVSVVEKCMAVLGAYTVRVPWNVVRALGNSGHLHQGALDGVLCTLAKLFDDSNVKVRWNTAYAVAQIFRNPALRGEAGAGPPADLEAATVALVSKLCSILHHEANFKVRIQACWALSALKLFPSPAASLPLALESVMLALDSCVKDVDYEQYKYRDVLTVSLKGLLLHVTRFCLREDMRGDEAIASALLGVQGNVIEILRNMLPSMAEDVNIFSIPEIGISPSKQSGKPIDVDAMSIRPHVSVVSAISPHDNRWLPLKDDIESLIASLDAFSPPAKTEDLQVLENFASIFTG
eukprot:TRINITY_DN7815_c0_g1_i1.p1 TRINITY_DN7815_c0_g1~~TRINITY_DN7815_c0_g1_i1.p1  ORF type:complete len:978 (+),score=355.70 TRINITY_DN7815_c0_g1_i1:57-2990(+)